MDTEKLLDLGARGVHLLFANDQIEAVRWRAEWQRLNPEPAPPPRPGKP